MKRFIYFLLLLFLLKGAASCKKQTFITDKNAALSFTADTLRFDTVFTSIGSVTQYFTIINSNTQKLKLTKSRQGPTTVSKQIPLFYFGCFYTLHLLIRIPLRHPTKTLIIVLPYIFKTKYNESSKGNPPRYRYHEQC